VEAVVELARDVDVRAVDAGAGDAVADARLVAVHLGGVDVAVADGERALDRLWRLLRRDLEDAEAELRNRVAVVQGEIRNRGHCLPLPATARRATGPMPSATGDSIESSSLRPPTKTEPTRPTRAPRR
jgi:hypothetical protein